MITTLTHVVTQNIYLFIFANCAAIGLLREIKKRQEKRIEANKRALAQSLRTQASQKLLIMRRRSEEEQWDRIREQLDWNVPRETVKEVMPGKQREVA